MYLSDFYGQFDGLRLMVNAAITYMREVQHEPGKFYEGEWEITFHYPGWDDDSTGTAQPDWCKIKLHCYLIGPSRHYEWEGTLDDAMARCKADVTQWCKEVYEDDAE